jgi:hypothetical protein
MLATVVAWLPGLEEKEKKDKKRMWFLEGDGHFVSPRLSIGQLQTGLRRKSSKK